MQLLSSEGTAAAKDSKTVRTLSFEVPQGVAELALFFEYGPRTSTDRAHNTALVEAALLAHKPTGSLDAQRREVANHYRELHNLMNVVLIDPSGRWRGRWDRNPASADGTLILGKERASRGFEKGEILPGRWIVAIECHGVFGADPVRWWVRVEGCTLSSRPSTGRWYFGEMHSHTVHSDGVNEPIELLEKAHKVGIDFVCLTDHNTMSALDELDGTSLPVTVVPGCELTTFFGHYPIYGVDALIPWHEDGQVVPLSAIAERVRQKGGLISVAHPFKMGDPICTGCRMPKGTDPANFDLMEVWYRRWEAAESDNLAAYALWNRYWSEGRRITAVAARDWHGPSQEKPMPGEFPFTAVFAEDKSPKAILEGLRSGRVVMSGGPVVDLELTGDRTMRLRFERLETAAELRILRNGESIVTRAVRAEEPDLEIERPKDESGWYRAELWSDGRPRAIGNHVVLEQKGT